MDDRQSFERIFREMSPKVYRYCTSRLGVADGEDATSETFHSAVKAFNDGRVDALTPAWIMTVARNKVIDRWRALERRRVYTHLFAIGEPGFVEQDHAAFLDPRRETVAATLEQMKPRHRMLLVMHYLEDMSAIEIASSLAVSQSSIESALARARRSFRKQYQEVMVA